MINPKVDPYRHKKDNCRAFIEFAREYATKHGNIDEDLLHALAIVWSNTK